MTLGEIIADLQNQLDWRGPGDKPQGHIVLPRSESSELLGYILALQSALRACKHGAEYPDELGDIINTALGE